MNEYKWVFFSEHSVEQWLRLETDNDKFSCLQAYVKGLCTSVTDRRTDGQSDGRDCHKINRTLHIDVQ